MRAVLLALMAACSFTHGRLPGAGDDGDVDAPDGSGGGSGSDAGIDAGIDAPIDATPPLREKTITISATVNGTLTDFPLWVSLTDADLAARARPDGMDIHFVDGTNKLEFEIQSWTKNTGRLDAWVRIPSLMTGKQIALRYGDVGKAHAPDPPNTFPGYLAVWHLDDPLNNSTIADARNMRNGTAQGLGTSDSVAARLGKGVDFGGGADQITFANPLSANTPHTISLWVNQRATGDNDAMIVLGNGMLNQARWFHSRYFTDTIAVGFYTNDYDNPGEGIVADGWVLLHWVYEGSNRMTRLYRDGAMVGQAFQHNSGINTQGTAGYLGNAPTAFGQNMGLNATLDEVRIIDVARSSAWIAAEAANQSNPSTFYTVGAEQPVP